MPLKQKALESHFTARVKVLHSSSSVFANVHLRNIRDQLDAFEATDHNPINCCVSCECRLRA